MPWWTTASRAWCSCSPMRPSAQFTMRRVQVTHRFDRTVFVRDTPIPKEEQLTALEAEEGLLPKEPLRPGERVLTAGSVELKRVVIDLESRPKEKPADRLAKAKARSVSDIESHPEHEAESGQEANLSDVELSATNEPMTMTNDQ